jgi:hypothetical protein
MKKVYPDTSPRACTWPEQPIFVVKKDGPETSPTACTLSVQPIYLMKKVSPLTSRYIHLAFPSYIYDEKKLLQKLHLLSTHGLSSLYMC